MTSVLSAAHVHANVPIVSAADLNFVESPTVSGGCALPSKSLPKKVWGRDSEIEHLRRLVNARAGRVAVLFGPAGCGKTTIALAAACETTIRPVFWISAHNRASFLDAMAAVAIELGSNPAEIARAREEGSADLAWRLLATGRNEQRPMLVIDNADDPQFASEVIRRAIGLSTMQWLTIITTRSNMLSASEGAEAMMVSFLSREDCAGLLLDRIKELDQRQRELALPAALQAADLLGRLPLALHLAGSNQGSSIVRYTLNAYVDQLIRISRHRTGLRSDEPANHLLLAVNLALAAFAPEERAAATHVLSLLATLAPAQPFPLNVLLTAARPVAEFLESADHSIEPLLQRSVRILNETALLELTRYDDLHVAVVHPLVARAARQLESIAAGLSLRGGGHAAASALDAVTENIDSRSTDYIAAGGDVWPLWRILIPHIAHVLAGARIYGKSEAGYAVLRSASRAVRHLISRGMYRAAVTLAEEAVERASALDEQDKIRTAATLDRGLAYQACGDLQRAFADIEYVARTTRRDGDPQDLDSMKAGHCLAAILHERGDLSGSETLFERVLEARRGALGDDHLDTLTTMHCLAPIIQASGNADKAEKILTNVVSGRIQLLGEYHPETLSAQHSLAYARQAKGGPESLTIAERDFGKVLADRQRILGATHPDTLITEHNLAWIEQAKGRYVMAERKFRTVMSTQMSRLGKDHPHTVATAANLAWDLLQQRQFTTARLLFIQVLKIRTTRLGANHPDTQTTRGNIGWLTYEEGDFQRAEFRFRKLLADRIKYLELRHPRTLTTRHNLALSLRSQRRLTEARDEFIEVLSGQIAVIGESHDSTLATKYNLAVTLRLLNERRWLGEAIRMLKEVLETQTERLHPRSPLVRQTKQELLAALYASKSEHDDLRGLVDENPRGTELDEEYDAEPLATRSVDSLIQEFLDDDIDDFVDPDIAGYTPGR